MIKHHLIKKKLLAIIRSIIYQVPNIYSTYSPIKIFEFKELIRDIKILKTDKILDIGCGDGLHAIIIGKKAKKTYGIDINKERIIKAKHRAMCIKKKADVEFKCIKLENAKFETESFDKIFSISVLEHIPNYFNILQETYKILKKGGHLIFSVDSLENFYDYHLVALHKKLFYVEKYFTKKELKIILEEVGFREIMIYPIFKSKYSKDLFISGIRRGFGTNQIISIIKYFFLKHYEYRCGIQDKGIFLIAKCIK